MEPVKRGKSMERGESFEVQGPLRVKRSGLKKSSGGMYEAFMSGFRTTFSVSEEETGAEADPDSSADSTGLIPRGEERLQQAEASADVSRKNPFDRDSGSENYARTVDSEESAFVTREQHHLNSMAYGEMLTAPNLEDGGQAAQFQPDGDDQNRNSAARENGMSPGSLGSSSDDMRRELDGGQQKVDVDNNAGGGLAQDSVGVSVAYQQRGSFGEYSDFPTHTSHEYSDYVDISSSTAPTTSSSCGGAATSEGGGSAVLEKKLSKTRCTVESSESSVSSSSTTTTDTASGFGREQATVSKRLSSFRSAERGESFEMKTPKSLRRQGRHGFLVGAGGFQTSIHFSVSENEEQSSETDTVADTITHTSEGMLESERRVNSTSDHREADTVNQSQVDSGQEDGKACVKSDSFEYVRSDHLMSKPAMRSDPEKDSYIEGELHSVGDIESSVSDPEGELQEAAQPTAEELHTVSELTYSFDSITIPSDTEDASESRSNDDDRADVVGVSSKRLRSLRSVDRGESFEIEAPEPPKLRRKAPRGFFSGGDGEFQTSFHTSVDEEENTTVGQKEDVTQAVKVTLEDAGDDSKSLGKETTPRLRSLRSVDRGESFEIEVSQLPKLRRKTSQGFSVGGGGFHTSYHSSVLEEEVKPDDTVREVRPDDTVTEVRSDDTVTEVRPDDTVTDVRSDDTVTEVRPDDTVTEVRSDDTVTEVRSDDTVTEVRPDDTVTEVRPDDTVTEVKPDDTVTEVRSDDTVTEVKPDDIVTEVRSDDTVTEVRPDDTVTEVRPDDTVTEISSDDTVTEVRPDDTVTEVRPDDTVTEVKPDDTVTEVRSDDTVTEVKPDDIVTEVRSDDTVTEVRPDDTVTEVRPDDTVTEISSDDTVTEISSDDNVKGMTSEVKDATSSDVGKESAPRLKSLRSVDRGESFEIEVSAPSKLYRKSQPGFSGGGDGFQTSFLSSVDEEEKKMGDQLENVTPNDPGQLATPSDQDEYTASGDLGKESSPRLRSLRSVDRGESFEIEEPEPPKIRRKTPQGIFVGPGEFQRPVHSSIQEEEHQTVDQREDVILDDEVKDVTLENEDKEITPGAHGEEHTSDDIGKERVSRLKSLRSVERGESFEIEASEPAKLRRKSPQGVFVEGGKFQMSFHLPVNEEEEHTRSDQNREATPGDTDKDVTFHDTTKVTVPDDVSNESAPRLKSLRSVDRGESFEIEVSEPPKLRRKTPHGTFVGAGGFQTSFHSSVLEEEDTVARDQHENNSSGDDADMTDNMKDYSEEPSPTEEQLETSARTISVDSPSTEDVQHRARDDRPSFERVSSVEMAYVELRKDISQEKQTANPFLESSVDQPQHSGPAQSTVQDSLGPDPDERKPTNPFREDVVEDVISKENAPLARSLWSAERSNTNPFLEDIEREASFDSSRETVASTASTVKTFKDDFDTQIPEDLTRLGSQPVVEDPSTDNTYSDLELRRSVYKSRGQEEPFQKNGSNQSSQFTNVTSTSSTHVSEMTSSDSTYEAETAVFSQGNPFQMAGISSDADPLTESGQDSTYRSFGYPVDYSPTANKVIQFSADDSIKDVSDVSGDVFHDRKDNSGTEQNNAEAGFPEGGTTQRTPSVSTVSSSCSVSLDLSENLTTTGSPAEPSGDTLKDELALATKEEHSERNHNKENDENKLIVVKRKERLTSKLQDSSEENKSDGSGDELYDIDTESHIRVEIEPETPLAHDPLNRRCDSYSPSSDGNDDHQQELNATTWNRAYLTRYQSFGDSGQSTTAEARQSSFSSVDTDVKSPDSPVRPIFHQDNPNESVFIDQHSTLWPGDTTSAVTGSCRDGLSDENRTELSDRDENEEEGCDQVFMQGERNETSLLDELQQDADAKARVGHSPDSALRYSFPTASQAQKSPRFEKNSFPTLSPSTERPQGQNLEDKSFVEAWAEAAAAPRTSWSSQDISADPWSVVDENDPFVPGATARPCTGKILKPTICRAHSLPAQPVPRPRTIFGEGKEHARLPFRKQLTMPTSPSPDEEALQIMQTLSKLTKIWDNENTEDDSAEVDSAHVAPEDDPFKMSFTSKVVSFSRDNSSELEAVYEDELDDDKYEEVKDESEDVAVSQPESEANRPADAKDAVSEKDASVSNLDAPVHDPPSWMEKAVSATKGAYDSLGRKLRRKSKKKKDVESDHGRQEAGSNDGSYSSATDSGEGTDEDNTNEPTAETLELATTGEPLHSAQTERVGNRSDNTDWAVFETKTSQLQATLKETRPSTEPPESPPSLRESSAEETTDQLESPIATSVPPNSLEDGDAHPQPEGWDRDVEYDDEYAENVDSDTEVSRYEKDVITASTDALKDSDSDRHSSTPSSSSSRSRPASEPEVFANRSWAMDDYDRPVDDDEEADGGVVFASTGVIEEGYDGFIPSTESKSRTRSHQRSAGMERVDSLSTSEADDDNQERVHRRPSPTKPRHSRNLHLSTEDDVFKNYEADDDTCSEHATPNIEMKQLPGHPGDTESAVDEDAGETYKPPAEHTVDETDRPETTSRNTARGLVSNVIASAGRQIQDGTPQDETVIAESQAGHPAHTDQKTNVLPASAVQAEKSHVSQSSVTDMSSFDFSRGSLDPSDAEDLSIFTEVESRDWDENNDETERSRIVQADSDPHGQQRRPKTLSKLHAQPAISESDNREMGSDWSPLSPVRADRVSSSRMPRFSRQTSDTDSGGPSPLFSRSVDSLTLVNFESQAAAQMELAAQRGYSSSVDEADARSVSSSDVMSPTANPEGRTPQLVSRDSVLSISSFHLVPSPQASTEDVMLSPSVLQDSGGRNDSPFFRPSQSVEEGLPGQLSSTEEPRNAHSSLGGRLKRRQKKRSAGEADDTLHESQELESDEDREKSEDYSDVQEEASDDRPHQHEGSETSVSFKREPAVSTAQLLSKEQTAELEASSLRAELITARLQDDEGLGNTEGQAENELRRDISDTERQTADESRQDQSESERKTAEDSESGQQAEDTPDGNSRRPSWMERALSAAHDAYDSLGRRLKRKKKKKAALDGDTAADNEDEHGSEEEFTDTEDDASEADEDYTVTPQHSSQLSSAPRKAPELEDSPLPVEAAAEKNSDEPASLSRDTKEPGSSITDGRNDGEELKHAELTAEGLDTLSKGTDHIETQEDDSGRSTEDEECESADAWHEESNYRTTAAPVTSYRDTYLTALAEKDEVGENVEDAQTTEPSATAGPTSEHGQRTIEGTQTPALNNVYRETYVSGLAESGAAVSCVEPVHMKSVSEDSFNDADHNLNQTEKERQSDVAVSTAHDREDAPLTDTVGIKQEGPEKQEFDGEITPTKTSALYAGPPRTNLAEEMQDISGDIPPPDSVLTGEALEQAQYSKSHDQAITEKDMSAPELFDADDTQRFLRGGTGTTLEASARSELYQADLGEEGIISRQDLVQQEPTSTAQQYSSELSQRSVQDNADSAIKVGPRYSSEVYRGESDEIGIVIPGQGADDDEYVLEGDADTALEASNQYTSGSAQDQILQDKDGRDFSEKEETSILRNGQGEDTDKEKEHVLSSEESSPGRGQQTELSEEAKKASFLQRAMSAARDAYDSMGNRLKRRKKKKTDAADGDTKDENGEEVSSEEEFTDTEDEDERERDEREETDVTDEITCTKKSALYAGPPGSDLAEEMKPKDSEAIGHVPQEDEHGREREEHEETKGTDELICTTKSALSAGPPDSSLAKDVQSEEAVLQEYPDHQQPTSTAEQISSEHGQRLLQGDADETTTVSPGYSSEAVQGELADSVIIQQQKSSPPLYNADDGRRVLEGDLETTLETSDQYKPGSTQDHNLQVEGTRYFTDKETNIIGSEQGEDAETEHDQTAAESSPETEQQTELSEEAKKASFLQRAMSAAKDAYDSMGNRLKRRKKKKTDAVDGDTNDENGEEVSSEEEFTDTENEDEMHGKDEHEDAEVKDEFTYTKKSALYAGPPTTNVAEEMQPKDSETMGQVPQEEPGREREKHEETEDTDEITCTMKSALYAGPPGSNPAEEMQVEDALLHQYTDQQQPNSISEQVSSEHGQRLLQGDADSTIMFSPGYSSEAVQGELADGVIIQQQKSSPPFYNADDGRRVLEGDTDTTLKTSDQYTPSSAQDHSLQVEGTMFFTEKEDTSVPGSAQGEDAGKEHEQTAAESSPETEQQTELSEEARKASFLQRAMSAAKDAYDSMGNRLKRRKKKKTDAVDGDTYDENGEDVSSEEEFTDTEDEDECEREEHEEAEVTDEITRTKESALYAGPPGSNIVEEMQTEKAVLEQYPEQQQPTSSAEQFSTEHGQRLLQGDADSTTTASPVYSSEAVQGELADRSVVIQQQKSAPPLYNADDDRRVLGGDMEATLETSDQYTPGSSQDQSLQVEGTVYFTEKEETSILGSAQGEDAGKVDEKTAAESSPETEQQTELSEEAKKASFLQRAMSAAKDAYDSMGNRLKRRKKKKTGVDGDTNDENGEEVSSEEFTDTEDEDEMHGKDEREDAEVTDEFTYTKKSALYAGPPTTSIAEEMQPNDTETSSQVPQEELGREREKHEETEDTDEITCTRKSALYAGPPGSNPPEEMQVEEALIHQYTDQQQPTSTSEKVSSEHDQRLLQGDADSTIMVSPGYSSEAVQGELADGVIIQQQKSAPPFYNADEGRRVLEGDTDTTLETSDQYTPGSAQDHRLQVQGTMFFTEKEDTSVPGSAQGEDAGKEHEQTATESSSETEQQTELSEEARKASFLQRAMSAAKDAYDSMGNRLKRRKKKKTDAVDGDTYDENGEDVSSEEEFTDTEDEDECEREEHEEAEVTDEITRTKKSALHAGPPGSNIVEEMQTEKAVLEQYTEQQQPTSSAEQFSTEHGQRLLQGDADLTTTASPVYSSEAVQGELADRSVVIQQQKSAPPLYNADDGRRILEGDMEATLETSDQYTPGSSQDQSLQVEGTVYFTEKEETSILGSAQGEDAGNVDEQTAAESSPETEQQTELSEEAKKASFLQRAMSAAKDAYDSMGNRLKRRKKKKTGVDGDTNDENGEEVSSEEFTDTEDEDEMHGKDEREDAEVTDEFTYTKKSALYAGPPTTNIAEEMQPNDSETISQVPQEELGREREKHEETEDTDEITCTRKSALYAGPPGSNPPEEMQVEEALIHQYTDQQQPTSTSEQVSSEHGQRLLQGDADSTIMVSPGYSSEAVQGELADGVIIQQQKSSAPFYNADDGRRVLEGDTDTTLETSDQYTPGSSQDQSLQVEGTVYFTEKEETSILGNAQGEDAGNVDEQTAAESSPETEQQTELSEEAKKASFLQRAMSAAKDAYDSMGNRLKRRKKKKTDAADGDTKDENGEEVSSEEEFTDTEDEDERERDEREELKVTDGITCTKTPALYAGPPGSNLAEDMQPEDSETIAHVPQDDEHGYEREEHEETKDTDEITCTTKSALYAGPPDSSLAEEIQLAEAVLQEYPDQQQPTSTAEQFSSEHGQRLLQGDADSTTTVNQGYSSEVLRGELADRSVIIQQRKSVPPLHNADDGRRVLEGDSETTQKISDQYTPGSAQDQSPQVEDSCYFTEKEETSILGSEQEEDADKVHEQTAAESSPETEQQTELTEEAKKASFLQRAMSAANDAYDSMGNRLKRRKKKKTVAVDGDTKDEDGEEISSEEEFTDTEDENEQEQEHEDVKVTDNITSTKKSTVFAGTTVVPSYRSESPSGENLETKLRTVSSDVPDSCEDERLSLHGAEELKIEPGFSDPSETWQRNEFDESVALSFPPPQISEDGSRAQQDNADSALDTSVLHPHDYSLTEIIKKDTTVCPPESGSSQFTSEDSQRELRENTDSTVSSSSQQLPDTRQEDSTMEISYPYSETFQCDTIQDSSAHRLRGAPPQQSNENSTSELRGAADSTTTVSSQYSPETGHDLFSETATVTAPTQFPVSEDERHSLPGDERATAQSRYQISSKTWQENEFSESAALSFQEPSETYARPFSSEARNLSIEGNTTSPTEDASRSDSWRNVELAEGGIVINSEQSLQQSLATGNVNNNTSEFRQGFLSNTCDPTQETGRTNGPSSSLGLASSYALTFPPPDSPQYSSAEEGRRTLADDQEVGLILQQRETDAANQEDSQRRLSCDREVGLTLQRREAGASFQEDSQRTLSGDQETGLVLQQQETGVTYQEDSQRVLSGDQEIGLVPQGQEATAQEDSQRTLPSDKEIGLIIQEGQDSSASLGDAGTMSYTGELAPPPKPPRQFSAADSWDGDQDDKPLIDKDAADDGNQVDQENIDPSKMPFSDIFKTTKAKKSKKGKDKDVTDKSDKDDGTSNKAASEPQHDRTPVAQTADDVTTVTPSSESTTLATPPVVKEEEEEKGGEVVQAEAAAVTRSKAPDVAKEETKANTSDGKTDLVAAGKDSPAVLYTSETSEVTTAMGEGPQLTLQTEDGAAVVDAQPVKADGSLPPETGREKESLLHDPNPDAMICCTIL